MSEVDVTPPEGTALPPVTPFYAAGPPKIIELPKAPQGAHRLKLYSPIWRGDPGDRVRGAIVGAQPNELPDGDERTCVMLQLLGPAHCVVFDESGDRVEELQPVGRIGLESSQIVSLAITGAALARLIAYAEQPELVQVVTLHAVEPRDGESGARNPLTGKRVRYLCFIDDVPAKRLEVDPAEMMRMEVARKAAAQEARGR